MPFRQENLVVVRIWNSLLAGGETVGHISIELPNDVYCSLWPDDPRKDAREKVGAIRPINHEFLASPDNDLDKEGRAPEQLYCFYTLDAGAILATFNAIATDPYFAGWTAIGDNILFNNGNAHSCASLAYKLLKAGGLYSLAAKVQSSRVSSIVTPDQLAVVVRDAKRAELAQEPGTAKIPKFRRTYRGIVEQETVVTAAQPKRCSTASYLATVGICAVAVGAAAIANQCPEVVEDACKSLRQTLGYPG